MIWCTQQPGSTSCWFARVRLTRHCNHYYAEQLIFLPESQCTTFCNLPCFAVAFIRFEIHIPIWSPCGLSAQLRYRVTSNFDLIDTVPHGISAVKLPGGGMPTSSTSVIVHQFCHSLTDANPSNMTQISDGTSWPPLINSVHDVSFCSENCSYYFSVIRLG